ncbi:MAG: translocation/assembly module TamB, partial [Cytophagales bacterium]|nr:translocation/assembly module TamB [Cytophaga sp.]
KAYMDSKGAELSDLSLATNHSFIGQHIKVRYTSLKEIMSSLSVNCSLYNNQLSIKDLLLLAPDLDKVDIIHKNRERMFTLTLNANGDLRVLNVSELNLKTLSTNIQAKGQIRYVTDPDKLFLNLNIQQVQTGYSDLAAILPASMLPSSIHIPSFVSLKGNYKGTLSDFQTALDMNSSIGNAFVNADIKALQSEQPGYKVALNADRFDLGKLLGQTTLGTLNGTVDVNGTGFKPETASATVKADIESIGLETYLIHNITFDGSVDTGFIALKGDVADTNLLFALDGKVNLNKDHEFYDVKLNLRGADFYGLGLTKDHVSLSANTDIYLTGDPSKNLNGHVSVRNILVIKDGKRYKTDSLVFVSVNDPGSTNMTLNSSMLSAKFEGNIDILSVAPAVTNHLNRYFHFTEEKFKATKPQNFAFEIQLNDSPVLREVILPALSDYNPMNIKGSFNSEEAKLTLDAEIPFATYDNLTVNRFAFIIDSDKDKLTYNTGWNNFKTAGLTIQKTTLGGTIAHDTAAINLQIKNTKDEEKLMLHTNLVLNNKGHYRFTILPDGLTLQGKKWDVSDKNSIEFAKQYVFADQFKLTQGTQSLSLQSSEGGNDMALRFSAFDLHTFSQIAEQDTLLVQGMLDGDVSLKDFLHNPAFTSELKIQHLAYKQSKVGNLHITADNLTANRYTAKVVLTDSLNNATISGYYLNNDEQSALNFNADIQSVELSSLEAFSGGQISGSQGIVKGNIKISGSTKDPQFNGDVTFADASTKVTFINQRLSMKSETITISPEKVTFNSFNIKDSLNNEAIINGTVGIKDFTDLDFKLNITTKNFRVLNTTAVNNKLYYGTVILDSKISVTGTQNLPVIKADIDIVRGSHFTFAVPDSKVSLDRGDGIIVFTSDSSSLDPIMLRQQDDVPVKKFTGMDISAKISIDKKSTLKLLVDPVSGDSLSVRGDADLNFNMNPSGQMSLTGRYIVSDGNYKASLENLAVRRFEIVKGSSIIWSGDPLDALVDISATYSIKTTPDGLVSATSGADSAAFRKPLPFTVVMVMKGELLKPVINFQLDMPENVKGYAGGEVYSKLQSINTNESEVNKQVFALLVLGHFIAPDNSGGGGDASSFARRSVSRMMSNELNKLSAKYVEGVQIDVDVQSYNQMNNAGQQQGNTQVQVGVTKSLLDERLSVQVGGNVNVEGQGANANSNAKNFTGDVAVEYKLTENGRWRLKGFRTNQYDNVSNGTIVATGGGIMFIRNYTHTRDLFSNKKKKK